MALDDTMRSFDALRAAFMAAVRANQAHVDPLDRNVQALYQCMQCLGMIKGEGYLITLGSPTDIVRDRCYLHASCYNHLLLPEESFPS